MKTLPKEVSGKILDVVGTQFSIKLNKEKLDALIKEHGSKENFEKFLKESNLTERDLVKMLT